MRRSWHERRVRKAKQEAFMRSLYEEQSAALRDGDPDTLEVSRDYHDGDGTPWRLEVLGGLAGVAVVAFVVIVLALVGFFSLIKAAING